jgi:hypothetical protein
MIVTLVFVIRLYVVKASSFSVMYVVGRMFEMGKELPLAECAFGWGQVLRLYSDYLDINGTPYALRALTRIRPTFRMVMGIPSARLELWFGRKKVILRGIAAIEDARAVLEYLSSWCQRESIFEQPTASVFAVQKKRGNERFGESLPTVPVPVRLLAGEEAYYSVVATLCGEPIGEASRVTYPARDQGTLILTNRRMIYIGRKSQVVVDYAHLLHVSLLRGAIAVETDYRDRREIFEIRKPEECAQYLETILERYAQEARQQQPEHTTDDRELTPEKQEWAVGIPYGRPNQMQPTDEIEIDGLIRRNWRVERMRTRLRNTDDYQNGWQGQPALTTPMPANVAADMVPDGVADVLSQEAGGRDERL